MTWALAILALYGLAYALMRYGAPQILTPDGRFYLASAQGRSVPRPYALRWLLPLILGDRVSSWKVATGAAWVLTGPAVYVYCLTVGLAPAQAITGSLLYLGLGGVGRILVRYPVLVDAPAQLLAIMAASAILSGRLVFGLVLVLVGAGIRETVPIWAAIFAWSAWPLVVLAPAVGLAWALRKPGPAPEWARDWIDHPIRAARARRAADGLSAQLYLLPWGACLFATVATMEPRLILPAAAALIFGYAQMLLAQDLTRLYHAAAPAIIPLAVLGIPPGWVAAVLAAHYFNPWGAHEV